MTDGIANVNVKGKKRGNAERVRRRSGKSKFRKRNVLIIDTDMDTITTRTIHIKSRAPGNIIHRLQKTSSMFTIHNIPAKPLKGDEQRRRLGCWTISLADKTVLVIVPIQTKKTWTVS